MSNVVHKQIYRPGPYGAVMNTTLCGRLAAGDDMNVSQDGLEVTCKLCRQRMLLAKARGQMNKEQEPTSEEQKT